MHEPAEETGLEKITAPRMTGPGSGKAAWVAFAHRAIDANAGLSDLIDRQSATIRELKAEVALLKRQIANRKPKGGRPPLDAAKAAAIEADLRSGAWSKRGIAARHHVSATTVQRIADRMDQRRMQAL
jgi:hypothetical protein